MDHPIDDRRYRCRRHLQQIDVGFADRTYTDERLNAAIDRFLASLAVPLPSPSSPDLVMASAVGCPDAATAADAAATAAAESAGKEETRRWWR